jgi:hypothetical protein
VLPGGAFSVGDHVLLRRNDRRWGVANGDRASAVAIDAEHRTMMLDLRGRRVLLDRAYIEQTSGRTGPSLMYGYAITGHSALGLTCDPAFVLITSEASREWCYTALSRGRQTNRLYAVVSEVDERLEYSPTRDHRREGRDVLTDAFGRSAAQTLASEVGRNDRRTNRLDRGIDLGRSLSRTPARCPRRRTPRASPRPAPPRPDRTYRLSARRRPPRRARRRTPHPLPQAQCVSPLS